MPTMTGRIDDVSVVKEGVSGSGRPWVLYRVETMGKKLTTFDGKWAGLVGQTAEIEYTTEQNGKYTNYKIADAKGPKVKAARQLVDAVIGAPVAVASGDTDRILAAIADLKRFIMARVIGLSQSEIEDETKVPF